jgi:hypothetical protein
LLAVTKAANELDIEQKTPNHGPTADLVAARRRAQEEAGARILALEALMREEVAGLAQDWSATLPAGEVEPRIETAEPPRGPGPESHGGDRIRLIANAGDAEVRRDRARRRVVVRESLARLRALTGMLAFYPGKLDECSVDGEVIRPQEGDFYGGWITRDIVGPMKGAPGTRHW